MTYLADKYVSFFTDFGFKKLFGEEANKDLLKDFLNELLKDEQGEIKDLTYLKSEQLGINDSERKAIFDLYCENEKGEKFIVEMQKTKQKFFKDRTLYYSTFPIRSQAKKLDWNFELKAVYTIAILDFVFEEDKNDPNKFRYDVKLTDIETNTVFYNKLKFIYLEMPKFIKSVDELTTRFDKWMYAIKNLNRLYDVPSALRDEIFTKFFEAAEIAKFTVEQADNYEENLKVYRDLKNSLDTALEEGMEKGFKKGVEEGKEIGIKEGIKEGKEIGIKESKIEIAKNMLQKGFSYEDIFAITNLTKEDIE